MKVHITAAVVAALLSGVDVHAAYKCVVDGKTTYQERPCSDEVKARGNESVVAPPSRSGDLISPGQVVTKEENARRSARVKSEYEPLARDAFSAYTGGRMMDYRDMTCLRTRQMLSKPQGQTMAANDSKAWASRKVRLVELESPSTPLMLTFKASEQLDPKKSWHKPPQQLFINATLDIEDGKPCVLAFSEWSREIR